MAQDWNDTNLPWQNTALPWKNTALPWNDTNLPWKTPPVVVTPVGDSLALFDVGGITLLHLGMI